MPLVGTAGPRITSPAEGTIVHGGEVLTVTVEASPADAFEAIIIDGNGPVYAKWAILRPPYEFSIPIPLNVAPRREGYHITADGLLAPGRGVTSEPVRIYLRSSSN